MSTDSTSNRATKGKGSSVSSTSDIHEYLYKRVGVLTCDGRYFVGTLRGFDHTTNIVLYPSEERVLRKSSQQDKQRQSVILNAMNVLKGDSVAVIGLLDDEKDREFRQQLSRAAISTSAADIAPIKLY